MSKSGLPGPAFESPRRRVSLTATVALLSFAAGYYYTTTYGSPADLQPAAPANAAAILAQCSALNAQVVTDPDFAQRREVSDRFEPGTRPALIRNATLWTGDRVIHGGDVLLAKGIIKYIGHLGRRGLDAFDVDEHLVDTFNAQGAWVTPTLVDLHSHAGVGALPLLNGAADSNSRHGIVQPWLRSLDGINTHDEAYEHAIAGGVGTALIIPGSANAIGGQGFVVKLRPTKERSTFSKLVDPPFTYNGTGIVPAHPPKWRHIKHACGENPSRVYSGTRMDSIWAMRSIYDEARKVKDAQDAFCARAQIGQWDGLGDFPEDLRLEALVDLFRGRVKAHIHCYEAVDLDNLVRLSNEFRFKIAAFHHAHETYLVPDVLKKAYGGAPASAIFANFARYKREAYRHSEFAPRILHDAGLQVIMKSDAPDPINMRDLLFEAQQAHYFGLPEHVALASVISTPAKVLGLDHRLGYLRSGYDADLVIWNSHPLQVGATPGQVFIDGIPQLEQPVVTRRSLEQQKAPAPPNFDKEAAAAVKYEGLQSLEPERITGSVPVRFTNVQRVRRATASASELVPSPGDVVVRGGRIACVGVCAQSAEERVVDLRGGEIAPGLTTFGGFHGLLEIDFEASTSDGAVQDPLPSLLGNGALIRAADGLVFGTRDALLAYRAGVTRALTAPITFGMTSPQFLGGLSAAVSFGATHRLEDGAVPKSVVSLHVNVVRGAPWSVSTQIAALRRLLAGHGEGEVKEYFAKAVEDDIPLIVQADGADIIASVIELKNDLGPDSKLKLVISGAAEAHLLANELASANVGVIAFPRTYPNAWDQRRVARRPPLEKGNNLSILLAHNVSVAIGRPGFWRWRARQLRFDLNWAVLESNGDISYADALRLATTNVDALFGLEVNENDREMVAYAGGDMFSMESKVAAVVAPLQGRVDLF